MKWRAAAFWARDLAEDARHPLVFLNGTLGILGQVVILLFLARLIPADGTNGAGALHGDYFLFAVLGLMGFHLFFVCLRGWPQRLRYYQLTGTLEACVATRATLGEILVFAPSYVVLRAAANGVVYLLVAVALGANIAPRGLPVALLAGVIGLVAFIGLGVTSAAITLVVKRGDPFGYALSGVAAILGGVLYPVSMLPDWLQIAAHALPITEMLSVWRRALQDGAGFAEVGDSLLVLLAFATVTTLLAGLAVHWCARRVRRDGSLFVY